MDESQSIGEIFCFLGYQNMVEKVRAFVEKVVEERVKEDLERYRKVPLSLVPQTQKP